MSYEKPHQSNHELRQLRNVYLRITPERKERSQEHCQASEQKYGRVHNLEKMKMEIQFKEGRWLVNGKRLADMTMDERNFMDDFFREFKSTVELYANKQANGTDI